MSGYVLIVESDPDLQRRIGDSLRASRYEIAAETEGSWAKRSIAVRTPDAVVLGTSLTDGPTFALADELRGDPDTRATPILFVASRHHRGAAHRTELVRRYAPAAYLRAPSELGDLPDRLQAAISSVVASGADDRPTTAPHVPRPEYRSSTPAPIATSDPAQRREKRDVERTAKTLVGADADLRGTLKRTPFARLLQRLFAERRTGSLLLMKDTTKKIVAFAGGYPVSVRSNVLGECLGQILLQQRLISSEALQDSLRRMKAEKRHQGEILVEMGVLSPYNLSRALVEQLEAKLFEIFSWPDAQFMFKEGDAPEGETTGSALRLDRSPAALILEGIRRHYDQARQDAVLAAYTGKYVALNTDPVLRLQEVTSDPTEQQFIREIDGRNRLETVLASARIPRDKARLLLVALSQAGMIAPSDAPAARRGVTPTPIATPRDEESPVGPAAVPETSAPLSITQLGLVAQTVRAQNHYWALGVRADDPDEVIDQAYETLARSFHPDRYRQRPEEDRRLAQEIFERLGEAQRVLCDPTRRRAYTARAEKQRPNDGSSGPIPAGAAKELFDSGMQHLRANRHREAVEAFRQAARMLPDQADFRAALGWALFREAPADARAGRAALGELRRAIQLDPKSRRARYYLGYFHAQSGQPDLAVAEFEKLLELDPGAVDVADELRRLRESL
jgi:tetratricopeptide (TPR) repeat protein/DNA-binding response OmpR family regulator